MSDQTCDMPQSNGPVSAESFAAALAGEFGPGMDERYGRLILEHGLHDDALALAFAADGRVAFRASWALEWSYFHDRERCRPHIPKFLDNFMRCNHRSVHRHYTKMLCDMLRQGIVTPSQAQKEEIAGRSFDFLIDPETKVAVKVWCMEILADLSTDLPWVGEHLADTVRMQMERYPSPAMLNHGAKLLRRIRQKTDRR